MKKGNPHITYFHFVLLLIAIFLQVSFPCKISFAQNSSIKIMSYNVCNGLGLDGKRDISRTADVILNEQPDVIAIQELDQNTTRSSGVDVLEDLAKKTNMFSSFGPAIPFQGGYYGIGVLSKEKPANIEYLPLPGREEQRCLLIVEFDKYVVCCSHWSLTSEDRESSVEIITQKMQEQKKPTFICGDFNATSDERSIQLLSQDWIILSSDEPTFPANNPIERIDYICIADPQNVQKKSDMLSYVKNAYVIPEKVVSDHRPIVVELDSSFVNSIQSQDKK